MCITQSMKEREAVLLERAQMSRTVRHVYRFRNNGFDDYDIYSKEPNE